MALRGGDSTCVWRAIQIQNAHPSRMQAISEDGGDTLREVEPERGIGGALAAQAHCVEDDGMHVVESVCVEVPAVWRKEPSRWEDVAGPQSVDGEDAAARRADPDRDSARAHRPECIGSRTLADDRCAFRYHDIARTAGQHLEMPLLHSREEAMRSQLVGDGVHLDRPRRPSVARIAAASSVMSIPTGHHAMQRPHPTQPDSSNWFHQVESLWVIHCR